MRCRVALLLALSLSGAGCFRSTQGTEIGVKFNKLTGTESLIPPGQTTILMWQIHDWYVFDQKLQVLTMAGDEALDFKTKDGNDIHVDVTIQWRIGNQKAAELLRAVGPSVDDISRGIVRPIARSIPRDALNELTSEEFYDSARRSEKEDLAQQWLAASLEPYGLVSERVILQDYRFDKEYQGAIDAKKVADQMVFKNQSAARAEEEEWKRKLEEMQGAVNQQIESSGGKAKQRELAADAYLIARQKEAEAILAERLAEAQGIAKQRKAISGAGGRTMVKLRIARALEGKRIVLVPVGDAGGLNLQRTDINALLTTLGIEKAAE